MGFPESIFQGGGAGAGGEEGHRGDFVFMKRLEGPAHHDVNYGNNGFCGVTKLGGDEVLKVLKVVVMDVVDGLKWRRLWLWWRRREGGGWDLLDVEERVVEERRGEG